MKLDQLELSHIKTNFAVWQAEEFVEGIAKDELESVVSHAAGACPGHTLALMVEGLDHYLTLRQRREFQVPLSCQIIAGEHSEVGRRAHGTLFGRIRAGQNCHQCLLVFQDV